MTQTLKTELLSVARAMLDYIDALPSDVVASLPTMPGFDRDWADEVIEAANWEAQPVAEVVSKYGDPEAFGEREIRVLADADLQKIPYDTKLFTAPPAVPHVTVIPEAATLTNINRLCPLDNNLSQTDFATGWNDCRQYSITNDGVPPVAQGWHSAAQGWNACRAAMLAQPVSQGYKLVPVEPTEDMQIAAREWSRRKYGRPIGSDASIGCYRAMLAKSPEVGK